MVNVNKIWFYSTAMAVVIAGVWFSLPSEEQQQKMRAAAAKKKPNARQKPNENSPHPLPPYPHRRSRNRLPETRKTPAVFPYTAGVLRRKTKFSGCLFPAQRANQSGSLKLKPRLLPSPLSVSPHCCGSAQTSAKAGWQPAPKNKYQTRYRWSAPSQSRAMPHRRIPA